MKNGNIKRFYTTGDVAKYCEVDVNTIKRWIRSNKIKAFKTPAGHFRIKQEDFTEFIISHGYPFDSEFFGVNDDRIDILIIDDDPAQIDLHEYTLNKLDPDFSIKSVKNGFEGFKLIDLFKPRLVLLDLKIPGMTSIELLEAVRLRKDLDVVKFIIVSAYLDDNTRNKLSDLNVDAILEKPVPLDELLESVQSLLLNTPTPSEGIKPPEGI